jgi:signal transduction histidine kinase
MERERQRLGRELHTGVGQLLAAIRLQLETVAMQLPAPPPAAQQALDRISTLAAQALEQVRSVSRMLHPPEWQLLSIEDALTQLWALSGVPEHFDAQLRVDTLPQQPELEVKVLLYRAAQEALSNLSLHSNAAHADLSLEAADDRVVLKVKDDGVGFDVQEWLKASANVASGLGLRSIREQAAASDGNLEIASGPEGTTLIVSVPFTGK